MSNVHTAIKAGLESGIPEGSLTVSRWAETYRVVSLDRVANPSLAGKWKNSVTPYLPEIMDAIHSPDVREILLIKSAQIAGTEAICNIIGYKIHIDPTKMIYCAETEGKARAWKVEAFDPMVRDTPILSDGRVSSTKSRSAENTSTRVIFRNGMLHIAWATSPSELSSRAAQIIFLDEEDAYQPTNEGSPTDLAQARMKTAGDLARLVRVTTPRTKEISPTYIAWLNSTQEKYFVPCPHCGTFQVLQWRAENGGVVWDEDDYENAYYVCEQGCMIVHDEKKDMLSRGEWRVTNPEYVGHRRSFWINEIYSPFTTWGDMALGWIEANQAWKQHKDKSKLQVFLNTRLAEWWEDLGERIDYQDLGDHVEVYDAEVPSGVLVLTAAADVQGDRIECEVQGFGRDNESWRIAYFVLYGNPALPDIWEDLYDILDAEYESANGVMKIKCACIDSGGHHSKEVYQFCKNNAGRRWYAIKGASTAGNPIVSKPRRNNKQGVRLFIVGTDTAKDTIFANLQVDERGPGYCHFPAEPYQGEQYDTKYFQMLCSEKKILHYPSGLPKYKYVKINPKGDEAQSARNEALDIAVYNLAALAILNPNYKALAKRLHNLPEKGENKGAISQNNDNIPPIKRKRREVVMVNKRF
jgi:Bacteriophage tail assembly protein